MTVFFTTEVSGSAEEGDQKITCDDCAEARCRVCGHEPCPCCIDSCDHPSCIVWDEVTRDGTMTHECQFTACCKLHAPEPLVYEARKARSLNLTPRGWTPARALLLEEILTKPNRHDTNKLLAFAEVCERNGWEEGGGRIRSAVSRLLRGDT